MLFFSVNFGVLECWAGFYHQAALRADVEMTISSGRARGQLPGADECPLVKIAWTWQLQIKLDDNPLWINWFLAKDKLGRELGCEYGNQSRSFGARIGEHSMWKLRHHLWLSCMKKKKKKRTAMVDAGSWLPSHPSNTLLPSWQVGGRTLLGSKLIWGLRKTCPASPCHMWGLFKIVCRGFTQLSFRVSLFCWISLRVSKVSVTLLYVTLAFCYSFFLLLFLSVILLSVILSFCYSFLLFLFLSDSPHFLFTL